MVGDYVDCSTPLNSISRREGVPSISARANSTNQQSVTTTATEHNTSTMTQVPWSLLLVIIVLVIPPLVRPEDEVACETLPSEIHIVKEEFDDLGRLERTCNGDVGVNKCEGLCNSQVQPSVITPTGFLKECFCCRESFLRERSIMLTHCYDPDGVRLMQEGKASLEVKIREPADCKCFKCGDFSR